ncbi:MAG: hypothetical protein WC438_00705 [Candidatus Pacearchaeota archaeon]
MAEPDIVLLGNKASLAEEKLSNYQGNLIKQFNTNRDENTTTRNYELASGRQIKTIYNEMAELPLGEEFHDQSPCNIGIYFLAHPNNLAKERTKGILEGIIGIPLVEGETTKLIKEVGVR